MRTLSKFLAVSAGALALAAASVASAATFIQTWTVSPDGSISVSIGDSGLDVAGGSTNPVQGDSTHAFDSETGLFTDTFDFLLPTGFVGSSVITFHSGGATNNLNFTGITFNAGVGTVSGDGTSATVGLQPISVGGPQHLVVTGIGEPDAAYGGSASFVLAGVPEPATWGLMIMGFGGVGALLRNRRRQVTFA